MIVAELPKTRSGKIMRRLLRDVAENRALGDVTTLTDSTVMDLIKETAAHRQIRGVRPVPAGPQSCPAACGVAKPGHAAGANYARCTPPGIMILLTARASPAITVADASLGHGGCRGETAPGTVAAPSRAMSG